MTAGEIVPIEGAIRLAFRDPRWGRKLLAGSLWALVPVLGWIVLCGWCQRAFERGRDGRPPLPTFERPVKLFVDGVAGFTTVLLWFVLPVLSPLLLTLLVTSSAWGQEIALSRWYLPAALLVALVAGGVVLVSLKALPAALVGVGATGRLWAAFDLPAITRLVREAFKPLLYAVVFYLLSQALAQLALLAAVVGIVPALVWNHGLTAWMLGRVHAAHVGTPPPPIEDLLRCPGTRSS